VLILMYQHTIHISFGDCDPVGLTFYPNYFKWFDATYHAFLTSRGLDYKTLADKLDCLGTGLIDCGASFRSPAKAGDVMVLRMTINNWREKTLRLDYIGMIKDRTVLEGFEVRGLFKYINNDLKAAPIAPLRQLLDSTTDPVQAS